MKEATKLKIKATKLKNQIDNVKKAHRRHEFAEVNTFQLFIMESKLAWLKKMIKHKEEYGDFI